VQVEQATGAFPVLPTFYGDNVRSRPFRELLKKKQLPAIIVIIRIPKPESRRFHLPGMDRLMTRPPDDDRARYRETMRKRVQLLLECRWQGSQRQMARDLGVTQGLISKIVHGMQGAGKRFLTALARHPGISEEWLMRGVGQPLTFPPKGTLPVAMGVLPGPPAEHVQLLTGARHPVAEALDRGSRYWLALQPSSPLVRAPELSLLAGDLMLMETDPAWRSRLDFVDGRLCGAHIPGEPSESRYELGKLGRDSTGFFLNLYSHIVRLTGQPLPSPPTHPEADRSGQPRPRPFGRRRPILRNLDEEMRLGEERRRIETEQSQPPANLSAVATDPPNFARAIVGVCVYMARQMHS
jgi:hypothetical protein